MIATRKFSENLRKIDSIGYVYHQITGSKLPSNRQVLQVFFYNIRFVKLTAKLSAKLAIDAVKIFWQQARIPFREDHKCVQKLLNLYERWKNIQRTRAEKRSKAQKELARVYFETLDDLFDIATSDVLETIKIAEDRAFLQMQRQKGRPGCMAGVDMVLWNRDKRTQERKEKEDARKRRHEEISTQDGSLNI